jgi:hypothetical protein
MKALVIALLFTVGSVQIMAANDQQVTKALAQLVSIAPKCPQQATSLANVQSLLISSLSGGSQDVPASQNFEASCNVTVQNYDRTCPTPGGEGRRCSESAAINRCQAAGFRYCNILGTVDSLEMNPVSISTSLCVSTTTVRGSN